MSKDRKKLLHIHSSVNDKQPTPATLELGELGVNNAKGNAFISTKNSDGEVVRFSEDETIIGWMEQKEVFPYEGYVRGSDGNKGVTEQDLLNNKSNIIIKLNQVVPENTDYSPYDEKVNGAKDIYGNLINPISEGGYQDGAGLAIDMSQYVMQGANPSFSSVTTTCGALFQGTTEIEGLDGDCGSEFNVHVENVCIDANDILNEYGANESNFGVSCDKNYISNATTLKGEKILIDSPSGDSTVDIKACSHISGYTNNFVVEECQDGNGKVEIKTTDVDVSADTTDIKSCDRISLESKNIILTDGDCGNGEITIETNDLCLAGNEKINVYGDETNVGLDCDGSKIASNSRVFGKGTLITTKEAPNSYAAQNDVEIVASQDIKEISDRDINETALNNICDQASNEATFYGEAKTNIGINCDGSAMASATNIKGSKVVVDASTTNLGLTAKEDILESAERDIIITSNNNLCETAGNESTFYGVNLTKLGISCDGNDNTKKLEIGGDDVVIHSNNVLCESGKTVSIFASNNGKLTIGGDSCDGNTNGTYPITYVRRPKTGVCELHAETVDEALDEVYDRSRISLTSTAHTTDTSSYTAYTLHQDSGTCDASVTFTVNDSIVSISEEAYSPESELLKKYTFWQYIGGERKNIGEIDIPKDHLLRDVAVVYGIWDGITWTDCPQTASENCHWYIKLVWNVFDPSTGHPDDKIVYLPADDFVKDTDEDNSDIDRGVNVNVWYDGKKNLVSATTKVTIKNADGTGTKEFSRANGFHTLNSYTLNSVSGDVKTVRSATNWTFDPFDSKVTITAATDANHINRKTVSWTYGDVKSAIGDTYDPGAGTVNTMVNRTMSFVIPKSIDNINRGKLTINHGNTSEEFDPATDKTMSLTHGKLKITHNGLVDAEFDTSVSTSYTMPHSALTLTYGATSGKSGSVVYNTSASTSVTIPTSISHLNRGKFTVKHCNSEVTFDPSTNTSITMSHSSLSYTHNGFTGTYNPCSGATFSSPHSSLTISYGSTCALTSTGITYNTSANRSIVVPKTISDITGGAIKLNECSGNCITVTGDICASGVVKATALYSTSDRNLKENINGISYDDYHKVSNVGLKSFNFKDDETKKKTYGVIAQDLQGVGLENIIHKDEQGNLSVDYTSFLILKIADLEHTIHELSNEIKNLKGENKNN